MTDTDTRIDLLALLAEVEAEIAAGIVTPEVKALNAVKKVATPCARCHGRGVLPLYMHVAGGMCFECNGTGTSTEGMRLAR